MRVVEGKGRGKGRGGEREGRGGEETSPLHAPLIHISGYAPAHVSSEKSSVLRRVETL